MFMEAYIIGVWETKHKLTMSEIYYVVAVEKYRYLQFLFFNIFIISYNFSYFSFFK